MRSSHTHTTLINQSGNTNTYIMIILGNAENTVMQALESLNDNQVNDFLSGKSPLNLSVRLGDHLMMIQVSIYSSCQNSQTNFFLSTAST